MGSRWNYKVKVKVNFSRYRLGVAQRVGRGIALLFCRPSISCQTQRRKESHVGVRFNNFNFFLFKQEDN